MCLLSQPEAKVDKGVWPRSGGVLITKPGGSGPWSTVCEAVGTEQVTTLHTGTFLRLQLSQLLLTVGVKGLSSSLPFVPKSTQKNVVLS